MKRDIFYIPTRMTNRRRLQAAAAAALIGLALAIALANNAAAAEPLDVQPVADPLPCNHATVAAIAAATIGRVQSFDGTPKDGGTVGAVRLCTAVAVLPDGSRRPVKYAVGWTGAADGLPFVTAERL